MRMILFDLGKTLEDADVLLPGALETLEAITALNDGPEPVALLGLISDFDMPSAASEVTAIQQRYYDLLDTLGIRAFFEPVEERVTLSTEVGVRKPAEAIFRAAVAKADPTLEFADVLFVTENREHVRAARLLGLEAVHFRGPGQTSGEVDALPDLLPLIRAFTAAVGNRSEAVVFRVPPGAAAGLTGTAAAAGAAWAQLDDEILVSGDPERVAQVIAKTTDVAAAARRIAIPAQRLHLVTQNGRMFQQEHSEVPVIVDKGRYLVVDLDPGMAAPLNTPHLPCYAIRPLPLNAVVFEQRAPLLARRAPSATVQAHVAALSGTAFEADLKKLVGFRTRQSTSAEFLASVEWAVAELRALGYTTEVQTVPLPDGTTRNVIAERPGSGARREVVLVTAHLDSVNVNGGAAASAPGADDNGSGSAGLLAIARAMHNHAGTHGLRLALFGGEEQGLFGSLHYVAGLDQAERKRIRAVVNMDMIASLNTPAPTVLLEGAAVSQDVIDALADAAQTHTSLTVQTSLSPFNSDHVPFIDEGIPAVLTIEGADGANNRIHGPNDKLEFVNHDLALEILRMNVGFLAEAVEQR